MDNEVILTDIAECLIDISIHDMTKVEQEIAQILIEKEYLRKSEHDDVFEKGRNFLNYAFRRKGQGTANLPGDNKCAGE